MCDGHAEPPEHDHRESSVQGRPEGRLERADLASLHPAHSGGVQVLEGCEHVWLPCAVQGLEVEACVAVPRQLRLEAGELALVHLEALPAPLDLLLRLCCFLVDLRAHHAELQAEARQLDLAALLRLHLHLGRAQPHAVALLVQPLGDADAALPEAEHKEELLLEALVPLLLQPPQLLLGGQHLLGLLVLVPAAHAPQGGVVRDDGPYHEGGGSEDCAGAR
mmetsp:Transcript_27010/g.86798  ORF Transcript_27010/g.86798 Transcript_27010/m.86798 type:complete len:221 (-) Transcript_27010:221-883(-)|eukprot:CAMPEP_0182908648 /NCGR_PEP_ID=MMETSP0034_2-20130328/35316_1 /TAXON_ID=156128 /ORGANISM="Nephroselmis pyriformis, Strain CCMP717" /LENGTH=220 /DNA_ID=CAMNT_0025044839 /DNA_START=195 /DNA_END=860 /DNA_ORIENTATION=+